MRRHVFLLLGALILACLAPESASAMQRRSWLCQSITGAAIPACSITVYTAGTLTKATIYGDQAGSSSLGNPITAGSDGTYTYYAPNGRYTEVLSASGFTFGAAQTQDFILNDPFVAASPPAATTSLINASATCLNIPNPVTGKTWCLNSTLLGIQVYDGTKFATVTTVNTYIANVKDFGAVGDGTTDDRVALLRAAAAIPTTGGVLYFPCGIYVTTSSSALLSITTVASQVVTVQGAGAGCTTLRQKGAGHVAEILGNPEVDSLHVADLTFDGNNAAAKCLDLNNPKDAVIERFTITGCLNHGIDVRNVGNLHNLIRDGRISSGVTAVAGARGINLTVGNGNHVEGIYFNNGGNDANHYQVALDTTGTANVVTIGNIFDGVPTAIKTSGNLTSVGEYFDTTSPGGIAITTAYQFTANNPSAIIVPRGITTMTQINFDSVTLNNLTMVGLNENNAYVAGQPLGLSITPAQLTGNTNDYAPTSGNGSSGLFFPTWRLNASTQINLTGIAASTVGTDGQMLTLVNVGANIIRLTHQDALSAAANRFLLPGNAAVELQGGQSLTLIYDLASTKWRVMNSGFPRQLFLSGTSGDGSQLFLQQDAVTKGAFQFASPDTYLDYSGTLHYRDSAGSGPDRMQVIAGLLIGAPTGGDPGAGSINAQTSYLQAGTVIATMVLTNASGTRTNVPHMVQDTVTLTAGTAGVALAGAAAFTNATSYTCVCDNDSAVLACRVVQNGGNGFTVSSGAGTDVVRFICAGS